MVNAGQYVFEDYSFTPRSYKKGHTWYADKGFITYNFKDTLSGGTRSLTQSGLRFLFGEGSQRTKGSNLWSFFTGVPDTLKGYVEGGYTARNDDIVMAKQVILDNPNTVVPDITDPGFIASITEPVNTTSNSNSPLTPVLIIGGGVLLLKMLKVIR